MPDATIARAASERGEIVLRRRSYDDALELRVNGVFVMDTAQTATERALARLAVSVVTSQYHGSPHAPARVLVGGLGLGFTLAELTACPDFGAITVAEVEPAVVRWHRDGLVPHTAQALADPRVEVRAADVRAVVEAAAPTSFDVIVLDVDNGPGYLVYDDNAALYEADFLRTCRTALSPQGRLVVWSAAEAPEFEARLETAFGSVEASVMPVLLGSRPETYVAYVAPALHDGG